LQLKFYFFIKPAIGVRGTDPWRTAAPAVNVAGNRLERDPILKIIKTEFMRFIVAIQIARIYICHICVHIYQNPFFTLKTMRLGAAAARSRRRSDGHSPAFKTPG
jgi:hypothetical protein